jgi:type II secretory pathway component PulF
MPLFKYSAKKGPKEVIEDTIEAESKEKAIEKLSQKGRFPIKIEECSREFKSVSQAPTLSLRGIKTKNIIIFSRQLASLLKSGVPLSKSLTIISEQAENPHLKTLLDYIYSRIKDGDSFSSVLSKYPKVFSPLYVAMIQAGESSGNLEESLLRIAEHLRRQSEFLSRVRGALTYPFLMALMGIATIIFMFIFVMPRLTRLFSNIGQELPLPTKIVLAASSGFQQWWFWILIGLGVLLFAFRKAAKTQNVAISRLKLRLPIWGNFILKVELTRFCRSLEILVANGIPISEAIKIAVPILNNEVIKEAIEQGRRQVEEGGSFGNALKKLKLFPPFMTNLIIVSEESGKFADGFSEIANFYERETNDILKVSATVLEPLMILIVGAVVGFIVIAMLLPIFQINLMVK